MNNQENNNVSKSALPVSPHTFHIPVMGTGFTIDTPLKVAKYGISSVVSLGDDNLIEQMRKYHSERLGESYTEIGAHDDDSRARRITAYLDLLDKIVKRQTDDLRNTPFEPGSEITRYFTMLPESELKKQYQAMLDTHDPTARKIKQDDLRSKVVPGSIDVNIMCSADRAQYRHGQKLSPEYSLACSALRGFALSRVRSSIVLSAGFNQRLYGYLADFDGFFPDINGELSKKIILKVSDFRSAAIQAKYLAKRGLWVSEFRIESGLNCGGHAFATKGLLLGPILQEFIDKKEELSNLLSGSVMKVLADRKYDKAGFPGDILLTVQGGIGTAEENDIFLKIFRVDRTGWGTPFLMVPEAVNMDREHLEKLSKASVLDVGLSENSPFGIPFWNLRTSASEQARNERINQGKPGSPCVQGYLKGNTEFTENPICVASRQYQKTKLEDLEKQGYGPAELKSLKNSVMSKACICCDLAGSATRVNGINPKAKPAICCGPNIVNFSKIATLDEIVSHIYGRLSLLTNPERPHIFVQEAKLYFEHLSNEFDKFTDGLSRQKLKYFEDFKSNLLESIDYYQGFAENHLIGKLRERYERDLKAMQQLRERIEDMNILPTVNLSLEMG